ncbi:MAG: 50S ribosomal protein L18, partial [Clostridia bacterium]|nr:50S ribosomal protein L18 [Clostridia bacterium]
TASMPRLTVFKSLKYIYAQIIDDDTQTTLASASSLEKDIKSKVSNAAGMDAAKLVGELIAERALSNKIDSVVFDRSGYLYHGKVQALAESAREKGLKF